MQKTQALLITGNVYGSTNHKLLGMIIDANLTYEVRVDELCNKLSKRPWLSLLRPIISPYLKKNQRMIYFKVVIEPCTYDVCELMYQVWTWYNREAALERVVCMQKPAARIKPRLHEQFLYGTFYVAIFICPCRWWKMTNFYVTNAFAEKLARWFLCSK